MARRGIISIYAILAVAVVCLVCLAIISRNWSCRTPRPPRPPVSASYDVVEVQGGAAISVKAGMGKRRTALITLCDIAIPEAQADAAKANLERLAGSRIRVEYHRGFRADGTENVEADLEGRDKTGVVYSAESGVCLNMEQIMLGLARNTGTRADFIAAEKQAKRAKKGLWANPNEP